MALRPYCDSCGNVARKNVAGENGLYVTRENLTVRVTVVKAKGESPIICERCVKLAAAHGQSVNGEVER